MDFRRGKEWIVKANDAAKSGGGDFRPFLTTFFWPEDQHTKYLLILTPIDDENLPMVSMQKVWTNEGRPEYVVARTERAIGDSIDPIEEEWGYGPQDLNLAVAVELEPTFKVVKGRQRPSGFEVKTRTYARKIRDESGEFTDEREEITMPVVGLIAQSPNNFFNHVSSQDSNVAPVHETPGRYTRIGERLNTDYEVELFQDDPLDLSNLTEFIDGVSYLDNEMDDLLEKIEDLEPQEAATEIGTILLDKRLSEICDLDYYNEILASIDEPARYPKKGKGKGKAKDDEAKSAVKKAERPSQRRTRRAEPASTSTEEPEADAKPPKRQARASQTQTVKKESGVRERLDALRQKSAKD